MRFFEYLCHVVAWYKLICCLPLVGNQALESQGDTVCRVPDRALPAHNVCWYRSWTFGSLLKAISSLIVVLAYFSFG